MNHTQSVKHIRRAGVALFAIVALAVATGPVMQEHVHQYRHLKAHARTHGDGRDLASSRMSDQGRFQISYTPHLDPIPLRTLHAWTVNVRTADGIPVDDATLRIDGGMPDHGHGLPTRPKATRALGNGDYLIEGLKFQMPGWWIVQFDVDTPSGGDRITFNLNL